MGSKEKAGITSVSENELPPEFKKFDKPFGLEQHVFNFILIGIIPHVCLIYYMLYLFPMGYISAWTFLPSHFFAYFGGLGTTVGTHRYWTHRTFKANKKLQYLLMFMQTSSVQYPIFKWCRDHRVHHKYTDTDADPHNSQRGFWFSHITWLLQPKHPKVEEALKIIDISDLARDPVVRFQSKYYWELVFVSAYLLPMTTLKLLFPEMTFLQIFAWNQGRYCIALHVTFSVNSFAHMFGDKPYDKYISSSENGWVSLMAAGEGWHNYHHTFPFDYKAAEFGFALNLSTIFIHFFAWIGWATDLKSVSHKLLVDRINRTGDGSHVFHNNNVQNNELVEGKAQASAELCWGWGDDSLPKEFLDVTETMFPSKHRQR